LLNEFSKWEIIIEDGAELLPHYDVAFWDDKCNIIAYREVYALFSFKPRHVACIYRFAPNGDDVARRRSHVLTTKAPEVNE